MLPWSKSEQQKKLGISMRGGGAKCAAYIGVLRALEEENIQVDMLVASSGGAIVAGMYAAGISLNKIAESFGEFTPNKYFGWDSVRDQTVLSDDLTRKFTHSMVGDINIEDLKIPLMVQATNVETGECDFLDSGSLADAVVASTAIPIMAKPFAFEGGLYIDGDISAGYGADVLRDRGIDVVIGLNSANNPQPYDHSSFYSRVTDPFSIMNNIGLELDLKVNPIDLLIEELGKGIGFMEFDKAQKVIEPGYQKTKDLIPRIKELIF